MTSLQADVVVREISVGIIYVLVSKDPPPPPLPFLFFLRIYHYHPIPSVLATFLFFNLSTGRNLRTHTEIYCNYCLIQKTIFSSLFNRAHAMFGFRLGTAGRQTCLTRLWKQTSPSCMESGNKNCSNACLIKIIMTKEGPAF